MVEKWCAVCKKATHDTADCWGPGTISVSSIPEPVFKPSIGLVPNAKPAMSGELRAALNKVLGRYEIYGEQGDGGGYEKLRTMVRRTEHASCRARA